MGFAAGRATADTVNSVAADVVARFEKPALIPGYDSSFDAIFTRSRIAVQPQFFDDQLTFRVEPQFTSINFVFGNSPASDYDTTAFYQMWGEYKVSDSFNFKVGRQELAFGAERVIGKDDWSPFGRFFDGARANYFFGLNSLALFYAKITATGSYNTSGGTNFFDTIHNFYGGYLTLHPDDLDAVDVYLLNDSQPQDRSSLDLTTWGFRGEKRMSRYFAELEATWQQGRYADVSNGNNSQVDIEAGPTFDIYEGLDVTLEYARASKDYNPLYPSGHDQLGLMDYFSRRNLQDLAAHARLRFANQWHLNVGLHSFSVVDTAGAIYTLYGPNQLEGGNGGALGTEYDSTLEKTWRNSAVALGASYFSPGSYFTSSSGDALYPSSHTAVATNSWYLQTRLFF